MEKFVIQGGVPLSGTVTPAGNKNGALPILAASVLTDDEVVLRNVPRIRDVQTMVDILVRLGVRAEWRGTNEIELCARGMDRNSGMVDKDLAERIRASFLLAGPLLARNGHAVMPPPGGDVIGRRRLDPHLDALRALGAEHELNGQITLRAPRGLRAGEVFMDEPSVMATENALLAAALTPGTTVMGNVARAPRAGPRAHALQDGRADRGHRIERPDRARRRPARRLHARHRP
jgi:UDP-N-acetylglucosamine 1-carboxyvinyltransferase